MRTKFASIAKPNEFAYVFDTDAYDSSPQVDSHFRMFATYGDGFCQHSGDWTITTEFMADYLASMATVMLADEELTKRAAYELTRAPSLKDIEFAASVVFKESDRDWSHRRYYSTSERKLTSSRAKQHDKRYEEVSEWNNGTPAAIYRMLIPSYAHGLTMYAYADAIRNWSLNQTKLYMEMPAEFLNWFPGDRDKLQQLRYAFNACLNLARAYQLRCEALNDLQNINPPAVEAPAQVDQPEETPAPPAATTEPAEGATEAPAQVDQPETIGTFTQLAADREVGETEPAIAA
jgi:hypothetical protein